MDETVLTQFQAFLAEQSPQTFLQLREALSHSPGYAPYTNDPMNVGELLEQERYEDAGAELMAMMPNWFLNPSTHQMLAFVFHKLGQAERARMELGLAALLLQGLLLTGDGSEAQPYLVLHTKDEYDVLAHLGKKLQSQALVSREPRFYDRLICEDGTELWFDVTVPYTRLASMG